MPAFIRRTCRSGSERSLNGLVCASGNHSSAPTHSSLSICGKLCASVAAGSGLSARGDCIEDPGMRTRTRLLTTLAGVALAFTAVAAHAQALEEGRLLLATQVLNDIRD